MEQYNEDSKIPFSFWCQLNGNTPEENYFLFKQRFAKQLNAEREEKLLQEELEKKLAAELEKSLSHLLDNFQTN